MGPSRDNRFSSRGTVRYDIDKATDTRTQIKEPEEEQVFYGALDELDPVTDLRISRGEFPFGRCDLVSDFDSWIDPGVKNPTDQQCGDQQNDRPVSTKSEPAFASGGQCRGLCNNGSIRRLKFTLCQNAPRFP